MLDELPMGSRYFACLAEDEELVDPDEKRAKPKPADAPSWREFDRAAYDFAQIKMQLEQILLAILKSDPSKASPPWVPAPASEKVHRGRVRDRLDQLSDRADAVLRRIRERRRKG